MLISNQFLHSLFKAYKNRKNVEENVYIFSQLSSSGHLQWENEKHTALSDREVSLNSFFKDAFS